MKVGKKLEKRFWKSSIINKFAKNWLLPSLGTFSMKRESRQVKFSHFFIEFSKGFMKAVKEFSGG